MSRRVVLVTGGAGALGRAVVEAFLADGWRAAVPIHRSGAADRLRDVAARHGDCLTWFEADVTLEEGAAHAVGRTMSWAGRLDAVVHAVGGYAGGHPLHDTSVDEWDRMVALNLRSAFLVARAAIPRMGRDGALVFVSSRTALRERRRKAAYAVAKSALLTLTEAIAEEYGDRVRANAVLPGIIDTPANRAGMPGADPGEWTPPEEIARVVLFLASPDSGPVSGAAVPVYGRS